MEKQTCVIVFLQSLSRIVGLLAFVFLVGGTCMHARLKAGKPLPSFFCSFLTLALIFLVIILVLGGWVCVIAT